MCKKCNDKQINQNKVSYLRQTGNISEVFEGTPQDIVTLIELLDRPRTTECRLKLNIDDNMTQFTEKAIGRIGRGIEQALRL